jgi:hypothetical protein
VIDFYRAPINRRATGEKPKRSTESIKRTADDPKRSRDYLLSAAMIASLRRAAELG